MLLAGTLSLDHLHSLNFLTCIDRLCPDYSRDRVVFAVARRGHGQGLKVILYHLLSFFKNGGSGLL